MKFTYGRSVFPVWVNWGRWFGLVAALLLAGCAGSGLGGFPGKKHVPMPVLGDGDIMKSEVKDRNAGTVRPADNGFKGTMRPEIVNQLDMRQSELGFVDRRFQAYQDERTRWRENVFVENWRPEGWNECFSALDGIAGRYRELRNKIMAGRNPAVVTDYTQLLEDDILFQSSPCRDLDRQAAEGVGGGVVLELEKAIEAQAGEGNCQEVISLYKQRSALSEADIPPEIMKLYAEALVRSGYPAAAAGIYVELKKRYEDFSPWLTGRQAARLFLAAGNVAAADREYQELLDSQGAFQDNASMIREELALLRDAEEHRQELSWFSAVLRGYLGFSGHHLSREMIGAMAALDGNFPETIYTERARLLYSPCELKMRAWVDEQLALADNFVVEKKFAQAGEIVTALNSGPLPLDLEGQVRTFAEKIRLGEEEEKATRRQLMAHARAAQWQEGVNLLDNRQYDAAIEVLSALLDSDYREEAEKRIGEAKSQAAADLRRQAAGLFAKARKTADLLLKGEILVGARDMLLRILTRYPDVDIIDKVRQNLEVIEKDIYQLDPRLLDKASLLGEKDVNN